MDILFASGSPYLPQVFGGVNVNTHGLAQHLISLGHRVEVLARLSWGNWYGMRRMSRMALQRRQVVSDNKLGYTVYRAREPWRHVQQVRRPDIVVLQDGRVPQMLQACAEAGMPAAIYFHGLEFEDWVREGRAPPARFKASQVVANSQFTAERLASLWGIRAEVIRPYFKRELYQTTTSREVVTFINPVREKGVELALAIAAECPNIPFEFVQGWPLPIRDRFRLRKRLRRLPNVSLRPIAEDMRRVYQRSRLLIVPSHWERETWGRVATEAQFSGIPVIAMNVGGLPEAVGSGGVLLGREAAAEGWAQEIRRLWSCEVAYGHLSQAAARHAEREEIWPSYQVRHLLRVLDEARAHPSR